MVSTGFETVFNKNGARRRGSANKRVQPAGPCPAEPPWHDVPRHSEQCRVQRMMLTLPSPSYAVR